MSFQPVKLYQTGTYAVGNRLLTFNASSVQDIAENILHGKGIVSAKFG